MADVIVRMTSEHASVVRGWLESLRGPQAFSQELDKIEQKARRAGQATKSSFADAGHTAAQFLGSLTGFGSVLGSLATMAQLIRHEYEAWEARRKESAQAQVGVFEAHMRATKAINGEMDPDAVFQRVVKGAKGVDPKDLLLTIESGISASGDVSKEDVIQMVMASAKAAPEMALQRRQALVTGALMLKKGFPEATPEQALAGVEQSFIAARTEDVTDFAKNMAPGIAQMRAFGGDKDSYEFLASMAIAMGQRSGDATGRRSMNATINMLKQVKEETLAAGLVGPDASVEQQLAAIRGDKGLQEKMLGVFAQGELGEDWKAKLAKMRRHQKEKGGDFGGELSGEAKSFIAMVEMLSPGDNKTKQEFESARGKIAGLTPEAVAETQASRRAVAASQAGQAGELERVGKYAKNIRQYLDPAGEQEKAIDLLTEARTTAGWTEAEKWIAAKGDRLLRPGELDFDAAEKGAAGMAQQLRKYGWSQHAMPSDPNSGFGLHAWMSRLPEGEADRRADQLDLLVEEIRGLRADAERARQVPQKVKPDGDPVPNPAPLPVDR